MLLSLVLWTVCVSCVRLLVSNPASRYSGSKRREHNVNKATLLIMTALKTTAHGLCSCCARLQPSDPKDFKPATRHCPDGAKNTRAHTHARTSQSEMFMCRPPPPRTHNMFSICSRSLSESVFALKDTVRRFGVWLNQRRKRTGTNQRSDSQDSGIHPWRASSVREKRSGLISLNRWKDAIHFLLEFPSTAGTA